MSRLLSEPLRFALDLVCPPFCPICALPVDCGPLCATCDADHPGTVLSPVPGVRRMVAIGRFEDALREAVHGLKFDGESWRGRPLGKALAARLGPSAWAGTQWDAVVAAPTTRARVRTRGYDQADRIARGVGAALRLPVCVLLTRADAGRQADRTAAERAAIGATIKTCGPVPDRVLLIDDVVTTGNTLAACARELRRAGATRIDAATVTWTPKHARRPHA